MIKFREKSYTDWSDVVKGGAIGSSLAVGFNRLANSRSIKINGQNIGEKFSGSLSNAGNSTSNFFKRFGSIGEKLAKYNRSIWNKLGKFSRYIIENPAQAALGGALVGASLVLAYWLIKSAYNKADEATTSNDNDVLAEVCRNLIKAGFKINKDFTTNPAEADNLRTKVCIVISKAEGHISINVNSISDPKLDQISKSLIKNLPSGSKYSTRESDRNNDLMITLVDSNNNDAGYIASVAERFIRAKYPVFIVELN